VIIIVCFRQHALWFWDPFQRICTDGSTGWWQNSFGSSLFGFLIGGLVSRFFNFNSFSLIFHFLLYCSSSLLWIAVMCCCHVGVRHMSVLDTRHHFNHKCQCYLCESFFTSFQLCFYLLYIVLLLFFFIGVNPPVPSVR